MAALSDRARLTALRGTGLGAQADPVLDRFARMVRRHLDVPVALVSLVDDTRQAFPGQAGLEAAWAERRETPLTHSFCQHVVTSGDQLVIEDARELPLVADNLAIADLSVIGYAGMPLTDADGNVLGSLCAISDEPRAWTPLEVEALSDLAEACSSELRLRIGAAEARAALARLAVLGEVTRSISATLDADEALLRLTRVVVPALADWCTAGLVDEAGRVRLVLSKHSDRAQSSALDGFARAQSLSLEGSTPTRTALRTGEAVVVDDATALLEDPEGVPATLQSCSALVVPLRARGGALGYLTLARRPDQEPFGEAEVHDALDIGRRAGLALDNAELFRQQRDSAESLQRHLLTRLPEPDHLHVVARYVPAMESAQIGGDWYDAFLQPDGATVLVVGDVMGHDTAAAAMMGQLRNLVRGIAYDREEPPAALLSRVDRSLHGLQVDTLATVVLARIEQTAEDEARGLRRLRWSSAGHPPPVLMSADGSATVLERDGELLLGIDPTTERTDHEHVLQPDSTLLLYTDGLVERRDSPLEHGLARLRQSLQGMAGEPLDVLCDKIVARMLPDGSEDDVALVAVRCYAENGPRPAEAGPPDVPQEPVVVL